MSQHGRPETSNEQPAATDWAEPEAKAVAPRDRPRRWLPLVITGGLLVALVFVVDFTAVLKQLVTISPPFLGFAIAAVAVNVLISSLRYQQVLEKLTARSFPFRDILRINFLTLFMAHIVPVAAAADGLRAIDSAFRFKLPFGRALESVAHDRILAVAGLLTCLLLTLPLQAKLGAEKTLLLLQVVITIAFLAICAVLVWLGRSRINFSSSRLAVADDLLKRFLMQVAGGRFLMIQFAIAIGGTIAFATTLYLLSRGLDANLSFSAAVAFAPAIYLSQVIPFFYAGFGAREIVTMALLSGSGTLQPETAVAISVSIGICNFIVSLPGALSATHYSQIGQPPDQSR